MQTGTNLTRSKRISSPTQTMSALRMLGGRATCLRTVAVPGPRTQRCFRTRTICRAVSGMVECRAFG